jgi:hypothetical protein
LRPRSAGAEPGIDVVSYAEDFDPAARDAIIDIHAPVEEE